MKPCLHRRRSLRAGHEKGKVQQVRHCLPAIRRLPSTCAPDGVLWTSVGVTAGIDLALALVEEDFGQALALEVARDLVMYLKRPGDQFQFSVQLASQGTVHRDIQAVQTWVLDHLAEPMPLAAPAARAAMSERQRVFVQETGQTPSAFVDAARLEGARRLLESASQPQAALLLKTIAARVGMGSEQALRQLFVRHLGITPQAYRKRFGGRGGGDW